MQTVINKFVTNGAMGEERACMIVYITVKKKLSY